jgi:hypothetical protein
VYRYIVKRKRFKEDIKETQKKYIKEFKNE